MSNYFILADRPTYEDLMKWFPDMKVDDARKLVPFSDTLDVRPGRVVAVKSGEFRAPKAGEWYLSGAIVGAYRAPNDLASRFHIAKIVLTKEITTVTIERELT